MEIEGLGETLPESNQRNSNQEMKENKAFGIPFITKKQLKSRQALHRIFLKPQYKVYRGASISMHPFLMFSLFQKYLNP